MILPMDIQEITNRPLYEPFHADEMREVVQHYIKRRKDIDVEINIYKLNNQMFVMLQVNMLQRAFDIASAWLKENDDGKDTKDDK